MSTQIRVDRVNQPCVPCGMNSILYLGGDFRAAKREYDRAEVGVDTWGQPNASYGVVLSVWDATKHNYVIKCRKGV